MKDYIEDLLIKVGHTKPTKAQISPYKHPPIVYGASKNFTVDTYTSALLDAKGILCEHFFSVRYSIIVVLSTTS